MGALAGCTLLGGEAAPHAGLHLLLRFPSLSCHGSESFLTATAVASVTFWRVIGSLYQEPEEVDSFSPANSLLESPLVGITETQRKPGRCVLPSRPWAAVRSGAAGVKWVQLTRQDSSFPELPEQSPPSALCMASRGAQPPVAPRAGHPPRDAGTWPPR